MADQRQILTDKSIARLPLAGEKQYRLPGFFVLIGKRRKSLMAQGECWRDGVRDFTAQVKFGDFGEMTTREARGKAKEALGGRWRANSIASPENFEVVTDTCPYRKLKAAEDCRRIG